MEFIIYASLVLIALLSLWALILVPKNYLFKSILIPSMIAVAISTWYTYQSVLGYGTEYKIKERVVYLYHLSDKHNDRIYILLIAAGEKEPRLHIYPWSEELEKNLEAADNKNKLGIMVVGEIKEESKKNTNAFSDDEEKYLFYDMPPNEWMPKNSE